MFADKVPRTPRKNLEFRRWLLQRADQSRRVRELLYEACMMDPVFWVSAFGWQYNPKPTGVASTELGPFVPWPFQETAFRIILDAIDKQHDVVIEKSRDMGASWLCLFAVTHQAFFRHHKTFIMISKDDDAVDKSGSKHALFWKIDWILNNLPAWMTHGKCKPSEVMEDPEFRIKKLFKFPFTNSTIEGAASTKNVGVGGRATAMFIDEFSKIKDDWEISTYTSATTNCRIFNSTHMGMDKAFYKLTTDPQLIKLRMHWSQHPDKIRGAYESDVDTGRISIIDKAYEYPKDYLFVGDGKLRSPWYDLECRRMQYIKSAIATDLDINPGGSVEQFFDAAVIENCIRKHTWEPVFVGNVLYESSTGSFRGFERDDKNGKLSLWRMPVGEGRLVPSDYGIGVDNAQGNGATPTCCAIVDLRTGEKVGQYQDARIDPKEFGPLLLALGWACRGESDGVTGQIGQPAILLWEINGPGSIMWSGIKDYGYPRLFYRNSRDKTKLGELLDSPGFNSTDQTKTQVLADYRQALSRGQFINPSDAALRETLLFRFNNGKVEHSRVKSKQNQAGSGVSHADQAMADALACMLFLRFGSRTITKESKLIHESSLAYRRQIHDLRQRDLENWI